MKNIDVTRFCILVFGNLGEAGSISLRSLVDLPDIKICAMVDHIGRKWIESVLDAKSQQLFCYHLLSKPATFIESRDIDYSNFGTSRFASLTTFKWKLIKESLVEQKDDDYVVFTDLDIFWRRKPHLELSFLEDKHRCAVFQDDSNESGTKFCTGIMVWKNTVLSRKLLDKVNHYNIQLLKTSPRATDENAVNNLYRSSVEFNHFSSLPIKEYVIGHKLMQLILNRYPYRFDSFTAFHANYCVGLDKKTFLLRIASTNELSFFMKLRALLVIIGIKLWNRLSL